ncbi:DUF2057 family protein [Shewanella glacialimarina]|jgi:hypothetical protein|uniref:DUF2057 family protein n=1 Tax=Shewanella glacialimarina TaxID=2590884 RepID=UPI001CF8C9F3|nr:DUF2057 family protein [Shewanella glacialimarina]UCX05564.1 DUF2057 domain-containing protein [Shewanella glacialimarina]
MKKFIAISLLSLASSASMAATISLPDYLIFTAIDGKPVLNKSQLEVSSGQHLIELQFYEVFSSGPDDTNSIKSDSLYWSLNLSKDEDIQVYTKDILSSKNAKNFIKSPFITLESATIKGETVKLVNHQELMAIIMKQHTKMMQQ